VTAVLDIASQLLLDRIPGLVSEWAPTNALDLATIHWRSSKQADWECSAGHRWTQSVRGRVSTKNAAVYQARPCPTCVKIRGSLARNHPDLAKQWHPDNNRLATEVSYGSAYDARWRCELGHEWVARVNTRTSMKTRCPYCSPSGRTLAGFNDLASQHPEIASEWDAEKNSLTPEQVRPGSDRKAWWTCPAGHSYAAKIDLRVRRGHGCPVCSGQRVLVGFNDLASAFPTLATEWSSRNRRRCSEGAVSSNYVAEWVCAQGHRWRVVVVSRTSRSGGTQCPKCWHGRQSRIEMRFWAALRETHGFSELQDGARTPVKWGRARFSEVDAMLERRRIVIEYDGWYWHRTERKTALDRVKAHALLDGDWTVIRIREAPLDPLGVDHENYYEFPFAYEQYDEVDVAPVAHEIAEPLNRLDG
jgi:very-short-patch-repair endonuclease